MSPSGARGSVIQDPNLEPDVLTVTGSLMPVSLPQAAREQAQVSRRQAAAGAGSPRSWPGTSARQRAAHALAPPADTGPPRNQEQLRRGSGGGGGAAPAAPLGGGQQPSLVFSGKWGQGEGAVCLAPVAGGGLHAGHWPRGQEAEAGGSVQPLLRPLPSRRTRPGQGRHLPTGHLEGGLLREEERRPKGRGSGH